MRHLAHDGEDRPLGRLAHRAVGLIGRAGQGGADQHRIHQLAGAAGELLGGAPDQLREDHAGVAAGTEQRGAGDRGDDLLAADVVDRAALGGTRQPVQLLQHRAQRQHHVVPGVAVGDREHVQVVDLLAPLLEGGEPGLDEGPEADDARVRARPLRSGSLGRGHLSGARRRRPLAGFGDLAGLQAARADVDPARGSAIVDPDALEVGIEAALGRDHRVATVVAERRSLGADVTDLGHRRASINGGSAYPAVGPRVVRSCRRVTTPLNRHANRSTATAASRPETAGALRDPPPHRQRGNGLRLVRRGSGARPDGRDQGARRALRPRRAGRPPVHARSTSRGPGLQPSPRRHDLRRRRDDQRCTGADTAPRPRCGPFIVMEYLAGGTVSDALRAGPIRREEAMAWLAEAASALDHAHARGSRAPGHQAGQLPARQNRGALRRRLRDRAAAERGHDHQLR